MKHNPKTCPLCLRQASELRHPVYRRLLPRVLPAARRGGSA